MRLSCPSLCIRCWLCVPSGGQLRTPGTSGLEVYGRFARDFDYELFRAAASKTAASETYASLPTRPHCDAGGSGPVVLSAVSGARTALFPGGITQRSAPDFASAVSKLAASASGPGEVAASALRTQALQTGMVRPCIVAVACLARLSVLALSMELLCRALCRPWPPLLRMWCVPSALSPVASRLVWHGALDVVRCRRSFRHLFGRTLLCLAHQWLVCAVLSPFAVPGAGVDSPCLPSACALAGSQLFRCHPAPDHHG